MEAAYLMDKGDIHIKNAVVHILDSFVGLPVLSDTQMEFGTDMADFLEGHIYRLITSDDIKKCSFTEESEVSGLLKEYRSGSIDFISMSKAAAQLLYAIMNANIDIPAGDLFVAEFELNGTAQLAFLKMNFKESYTHTTVSDGKDNTNNIMKHRSILPGASQHLTEAAVVRLDDMGIMLTEKKYEVNGQKINYFSKLFLGCTTRLSQKAKLSIVEKAVDTVQKEYFDEAEQFEERMKAKSVIHEEIATQGRVSIPEAVDKIFEGKPDLKEKFKGKIEKYNIDEAEPIEPKNEATTRKFGKQHLTTDTGIEIKIPMEQYNSTESIEFITNDDGTISVLIKNIGRITSK